VCHNYRFFPMIAELRGRILGGDLGPVHAVRGAYVQDWLLETTDTNWRVDASRGGASRTVADIGTHWIDLAETVTGRRLEAVAAQLSTIHPRRPAYEGVGTFATAGGPVDEWLEVTTEDQAQLLLRFGGGLPGALVLSQVAAGHKNDLELTVDGATGSATWRQERPDLLAIGRRDRPTESVVRGGPGLSPESAALTTLPAGHPEGWADGLRNLLAAAYRAIRGAGHPPVPLPTFEDGLRHLAFVEAAIRSAREERWVAIAEVLTEKEVEG
jgi:predicted dehydrogenase